MKKALLTALLALALPAVAADKELLNASYDSARVLFARYTALYEKEHPDAPKIKQSHAGSSKQATAILQGLKADVVTFNQVTDVEILASKGKLLPENWRERLPHNSSPYYSTTAFLVRKGNPKHIENWGDLAKEGVSIVFPNPKTSGNGRYTYLHSATRRTPSKPKPNSTLSSKTSSRTSPSSIPAGGGRPPVSSSARLATC